jgi:single-stranded-DNA-specific exonuclease
MTTSVFSQRPFSDRTASWLQQSGLHPLLARLYAARGIVKPDELSLDLQQLLSPVELKNCISTAALLAEILERKDSMLVVADYDCDGATACAVALRGLKMLGGPETAIQFLVPNRFTMGYGLTPEVVDLAAQQIPKPKYLITVDNGIASEAGVDRARELGMEVIVTDHHLPGDRLPKATAIVNPNQPGCTFPSKALAGVGVMFYLLVALRAELRRRGKFTAETQPKIENLLDLVALGTVADVAQLDRNNRIPFIDWEFINRCNMLDTRIVDQNIRSAQLLCTFSDHRPDFIWLHHIRARMECFTTACGGEFRHIALYGICITKAVDHDISARGRKGARITQTNARC